MSQRWRHCAGSSAPRTVAPGAVLALAALLCLLVLGLRVAAASSVAPLEGADPASFPTAPGLHAATDFWRRVYTEIDTSAGFLHDNRHLDVVYEVVEVEADVSRRARSRLIQQRVTHYRRILEKLAAGRRSGLSPEEAAVLALWPDEVSNATLASAARSIRFQLGQSDRFIAGLERSGNWLDYIEQEFVMRGLPAELALLPHVESSFTPTARSHASAVGMWQFTRPTGRRFMRIDHVVDERLDPFLASTAAARLLAQNYEDLGHWPLALTAYNHGVAGMRRAVSQLGTTDMGEIAARYKSRTFGFASRNFYASFLAAVHVHRHAEQYFGDVAPDPAADYRVVELDDYVPAAAAAAALEVSQDTLEKLNPALRWPVWQGDKHIPRGYRLRLPAGYSTPAAVAALAGLPPEQRFAAQIPDYSHRVERGESLSVIASRYGVSARAIAELNNLRSAHFIRIGQELKLPLRKGQPPAPTATLVADGAPTSATAPASPIMTAPGAAYRVRRGDSLSVIAQRLGVDADDLIAANQLTNAHMIREGQMLVIPDAEADYQRYVPEVYTVRHGDSVWELARRFRIGSRQIAALNGLGDTHRIYVGQQLRLRPAADETTGN
jgi:membrane-bound lytic murein transglycosylase D